MLNFKEVNGMLIHVGQKRTNSAGHQQCSAFPNIIIIHKDFVRKLFINHRK